MKGLKHKLKRPAAVGMNSNVNKDTANSWTHQDQRVWHSVANNHPTKVAAKLSKHPDVDVNKICPNVGYSVVHYAAAKGLDDCLNILLAHRADASACDITGATPLHAAARYGHKGTTSKLLASRSVQVNLSDKNLCTALHFASFEGHADCVCLIADAPGTELHCTDKDGRTPLMVAAAMGHINICKELLKRGSDVHHKDNKLGHTALTLAADSGHAEVVRLLCEYGAQHSVTLHDGRTALNLAKQRDRRSVIDVLHVMQLTEAAKKGPNGPRLSTSKYKSDDSTQKKRHSVDSLLEKQPQTFIDDLVAGTHSGSRTPKPPRRTKEEKKYSKSNIAKVKAAVEAKMKTNSRRGSNASGLSAASTPKTKSKKESSDHQRVSPGSNRLSLYTDTNNSTFYDKEMKFCDTSLSNSSLDVSSTCSAALNNISKSMDSLKPTPEELEGPVFAPSSNGSVEVKQTLMEGTDFSRSSNENKKHEKAVLEYEQRIRDLEARVERSKEVAIATEKLQKNAEEIRIAQFQAEKEASDKNAAMLKLKILKLEKQIETEKSESERNASELQKKVKEMEESIASYEEQNKDMHERLQSAHHVMHERLQTSEQAMHERLQASEQVAATARDMEEMVDKTKQDVQNLQKENEKLQERMKELEKKNKQVKQDLQEEKIRKEKNESAIINSAKQKVNEAEQRCNQVELKLDDAEQRCSEAKQQLLDLTGNKHQLEKELKELQAKFDSQHEEFNKISNDTKEVLGMVWLVNGSTGEKPVDLHELKSQVQALVDKLKTEEGQSANAEQKKKLVEATLNSNLEEKTKRISHLEKQVRDVEEALAKKTAESSRLEAELLHVKHCLNEAESEKRKLKEDLGSEIAKNRAELAELQAEKITEANQYSRSCVEVNNLRKELDEALTTLEKVRNESVKLELYNSDCERWKEDVEILRSELTEALAKYAQVQLEIANKEKDISDLRVERNQSEARSSKFESEVVTLRSKVHESEVQVNILRQQLTDAKHKVEKAVEENNNLRKARRDLTLRLTAKQGEMNEGERKKVDSLRKQLENLCSHLQESERRYKDTISIYRGHLLAAVKGELDPDVLAALQEILKLRVKDEEKGQGSSV